MAVKKENRHRRQLIDAALKYLGFSSENATIAEEIAAQTADMVIEKEQGAAGTYSMLTLEQKVKLAANTCIRHNYTSYDDRFIEKTIEQSSPMVHEPDTDGEVVQVNEVGEFIRLHRK